MHSPAHLAGTAERRTSRTEDCTSHLRWQALDAFWTRAVEVERREAWCQLARPPQLGSPRVKR